MTRHSVTYVALLVAALMMSTLLYRWLPTLLEVPRQTLEQHHRTNILWRHTVQLLQRHAADVDTTQNLTDTLRATRITLREAIDALGERRDVSLYTEAINQSPLSDLPQPLVARFRILRLTLVIEAAHGGVLLETLNAVRQAVDTWPSEWSACHIHRQPPPVSLHARCTLDIVHDDAMMLDTPA